MIQAGYPPKMLQEILGHASITTTLDLYGHLYPGEMDRYADRLDEAAGDAAERPTMRPKCGQMTMRMRTTQPSQGRDLRIRGALGGTRTPNLLIRSQMLYPLSYECTHPQYTAVRALTVRACGACARGLTAVIERLIF